MKVIIFWLFIALVPRIAHSQTKTSNAYPIKKGDQIELRFDFPKLIRINTWDKDQVLIEASVKINGGENNDAFTLVSSSANGKLSISNKIDMDHIPDAYFLVDKGIKTRFSNKAAMDSYRKENGTSGNTSYFQQKDIEVTLDIKVPANRATDLSSVYGKVELINFNGPIKVDAKYGGIDASLNESNIGKITLTNHFGKIYTNLNLKATEKTEKSFFTSITAFPGKGPDYSINANYGNIYLRSNLK